VNVRLVKLPAVFRYAAIFWAFYELFMLFVVEFRSRVVLPGSVMRVALYSLACGAINLLVTMALFWALDELSIRASRRTIELTALLLIICATVLLMMSADAALRACLDGAPWALGDYLPEMLRMEFHDSLLTVAFVTGLGNGMRSWAGENARKIRESDLSTAIARAEIEVVAARLRPAAVSEALREIGAAVEGDPARARALTLQLATTLRASFGR
jgi:hypothetical protein